MKTLRNAVILVLAVIVLFVAYLGLDWYRFTTKGELSPTRGAFGNPKLEIWIDVNARLPDSMRLWGCRTLMARQTEIMGRPGPEPWGCQKGFGAAPTMTRSQTLVQRYAEQAAFMATQRGASEEQARGVLDCVKAGIIAEVGPEALAALDKEATSKTAIAINTAARAPTQSCLKAIGK